MHDERLIPVERERRHRVWWTVYTFDRLGCSKVGQPALIRDEDIDTPLPSNKGLSDAENAEFREPEGLIAKVKLAEITGSILDLIYRAPRAREKDHFMRNVHLILARLRTWDKQLPAHLRMDNSVSPPYGSRPVASLRLHFNDVGFSFLYAHKNLLFCVRKLLIEVYI
jgi:proline utilization trans-activator